MPKLTTLSITLSIALHAGATMPEGPVLLVAVNGANPVESITRQQLRMILLGETREWPNHQPVTIVQRDRESAAFQKTLKLVLGMGEADYKRALLHAQFRGEAPVRIKTLLSNDSAARFVLNVPSAIAILEPAFPAGEDRRIKILRIEGKMPGEKGYVLQ